MKTIDRATELRVNARAIILAGMTGALICAPIAAAAQAMVEGGAIANATTGPATAPRTTTAAAGSPVQMTISMTPVPAGGAAAAAAANRGPNCTGAITGESNVVVALGKSSLIPLHEPVRNRTLGNPAVAQATMVSPQTLYVVGLSIGSTNMIVQGRSGACSIINVVVNADAGGLQTSLAQLMPGERQIRVTTAADNLVLTGNVSNPQAAQQAMEIARAYAGGVQGDPNKKGGNVMNMLTVDAPQQVMLEVKVAEVSKTLLNQLGAAFNLQGGFGSWTGALVGNLLSGGASNLFVNKANNLPFKFQIDAQANDSLVKILAEPNLVTLSGQEASFLAGGKIFIPVAQSSAGGIATITLQQEEFGVGLKFTPTVMANGRINLKVMPEVSELSPTGATVSSTGQVGSTVLPLITTRRASTTVQMRDGESFAIGGLMRDNVLGSLKALPGVGELPVLGTLFRSTSFQHDLTELVFIITPRLVQPLPSGPYPLPTDSFSTPNPALVYLNGNMEGSGKPATAAPAATPAAAPTAPTAPTSPAAPGQPAAMAPAAPEAPAKRAPAERTSALAPIPPATPARPTSTAAKPAEDIPLPPAEVAPAAATRPTEDAPAALPAGPAASAPPANDTAARIARIEATAARLARARAEREPASVAATAAPAEPATAPAAN